MSKKIKKLRKKLKMSRHDFASALGLSVGCISHYENGIRVPGRHTFYKLQNLAALKGVQLNYEDVYPPKQR